MSMLIAAFGWMLEVSGHRTGDWNIDMFRDVVAVGNTSSHSIYNSKGEWPVCSMTFASTTQSFPLQPFPSQKHTENIR